jgi:putative chitinase
MVTLADVQRRVGVAPDGVWGPQTLAAVAKALGIEAEQTKLSDAGTFFAVVRRILFGGKLSQEQVSGLNAVTKAVQGWPISWAAYALATAYHETAHTMQPVREAYWLSEDWRRANLRYFPHYGRGYVQLTWDYNYAKADQELGLDGALVANLDLAMNPDTAAKIMRRGMEEGWFTGKKLADYLPYGPASLDQFKPARRIINGMDKATEIAGHALRFQDALKQGMWG